MIILKNKDLIIAIIGICLLAVFIFTDETAQVVADGTESTESEWRDDIDSETEELESENLIPETEEDIETEAVIPETEEVPETEVTPETEEVPEIESETEIETEIADSSWVAELETSKETTQILVIAADGTYATISLHTQDAQGIWVEHFSVTGRVGKNGIGKAVEGDGKTPTGKYSFMKAFGILPDPGITALPYLQVDESHHWVDDANSKYYNQCVSTNDVEVDWVSSESLYATGQAYNYALAINYNEACIPGLGSAIFLHCPSADFGITAGCIAIPEENMVMVMQLLQEDCVIIIDEKSNVFDY